MFPFHAVLDFYCDYLRFMAIVAETDRGVPTRVLYIVGRGKFVGFLWTVRSTVLSKMWSAAWKCLFYS